MLLKVLAGSSSICLAGRAGIGVGILSRPLSPRGEKGACLLLGATCWARASLETCAVAEQSLTFVVLASQAGQPPGTCNNPGMVSAIIATPTLARGVQHLLELPEGFLPSLLLHRERCGPFSLPPLTHSARIQSPGCTFAKGEFLEELWGGILGMNLHCHLGSCNK